MYYVLSHPAHSVLRGRLPSRHSPSIRGSLRVDPAAAVELLPREDDGNLNYLDFDEPRCNVLFAMAKVAPAGRVGGTRSMFGDQVNSRKSSAPSYGFGSATREQAAKVSEPLTGVSPGPAVYTLRNAVGTQVDGRKPSSAQWQFGTSKRFTAVAMVEKKNPGPGTYEQKASVGIQVSARRRGSTRLCEPARRLPYWP